MIYLDNAATTGKKPKQVIDAVNYALNRLSVNPGRSGNDLSQNAAVAVYNIRSEVSDFFGSDGAQTVIFTSNCTESLNFVIKGVLKKDDRVIVSDIEHNAVMRPLYASGVKYDIAEISTESDDKTVENFKRFITDKTKMIICTGASNVLGIKPPIKEIGKLCKENNILFTVDGAQIAGISKIDMKEMNIDYLCIAPHKGLYAPMGVGTLIARKPIEKTLLQGGTGTDSALLYQEPVMPEGFESGTVNLPAILGIGGGLKFLKNNGIDRLEKYEMSLIDYLYKELLKIKGVILYTDLPDREHFAPVLSFNIKGYQSDEISAILNKNGIAVRAGLHCAPSAHKKIKTMETGTVRVCPSAFTSVDELKKFLKVIKNVKKS